jgi:hypothetical protein
MLCSHCNQFLSKITFSIYKAQNIGENNVFFLFLRHCIGITEEPPANQNWYCNKCKTSTSTTPTPVSANQKPFQHQQQQTQQTQQSQLLNIEADQNSNRSLTNSGNNSNEPFLSNVSNSSITSDYLQSLKKKKKKST